MRGDDDVVAGEDRVLGEGLSGEDVERGAADLAGLEAGEQRVEVDQLAAGAVDDPHAVLHRGDRLGVDQADRLRRLRHVHGDHVGAAEELVELGHALDAELAEALGGDELVEGDHVHLEGLGAFGDELADATEADDPDRLAVELGALVLGPVPAAVDEGAVGLGDVAEEGECQGEGVLGGGDRVRFGRVGDDDSATGRGGNVDVVDAGASAADHLEVGRRARSAPGSAWSPSGSGSRRSRRSPRRAPRRTSRGRGRRRSSAAAGRRRSRRSSP